MKDQRAKPELARPERLPLTLHLRRTVWSVPPDFGQLVGHRDFEQARGVVMETFGCTAAEAMTLITDACQRIGGPVETVVAALRVARTDVQLIIGSV